MIGLGLTGLPCVLLDAVVKVMGEEARYDGVCLLFEMLQQPLLNKQVRALGMRWFFYFWLFIYFVALELAEKQHVSPSYLSFHLSPVCDFPR